MVYKDGNVCNGEKMAESSGLHQHRHSERFQMLLKSEERRHHSHCHTSNICLKDPQAAFGVFNSILTSCMPLHWTNKRQVKRVFLLSRGEPLITCLDPWKKKLSLS